MYIRAIRGRALLILALAVASSSALFSVAYLSAIGFYRSFSLYAGGGEDVIVIYDERSSTPFTGLVPMSLEKGLLSMDGVIDESPEVLVPAVVNQRPIFVRGVEPSKVLRFEKIRVIEGSWIRATDLSSAAVGYRLSEALSIDVGDEIFIQGVLSDSVIRVEVLCVFASDGPMDDEILVPLPVGQLLRGSGSNYVTLMRVRVDTERLSPQLLQDVLRGGEGEGRRERTPSRVVLPISMRPRPGEISVRRPREFMAKYLERYGATASGVTALSVVLFLLSSYSIIVASAVLIKQHSYELRMLRRLGASSRGVKTKLLLIASPLVALSAVAGALIGYVVLAILSGEGGLILLSHSIVIDLDPLLISLPPPVAIAMTAIGLKFSTLEP